MNKNKIYMNALIFALMATMVGCGESSEPISSPEPATEAITEAVTEAPTEPPQTAAPATEPAAPAEEQVTETEAEKPVTVSSIVGNAKKYIEEKGVFENKTIVEASTKNTSTKEEEYKKVSLESGFNQSFYYIIEKDLDSEISYQMYVNNDKGYIYNNGENYVVDTDLILLEANIKDFSSKTLSEFIMNSIILDEDECSLREDENNWYIDQKLHYGDLAIKKANTLQFPPIGDEEQIKQTLTFDKATGALIKSQTVSTTLDVSSNTENHMDVEVTYTYEQTHDFPSGLDTNAKEINAFYGFSVY